MTIAVKSIQRLGNSKGVVLPADALAEAGFELGDEIIIQAEHGRITLSARSPVREEVMKAFEIELSHYDDVFRRLAE